MDGDPPPVGDSLCFTRVFGFDCGEGLIWGGGPPCFTRVFGFDCGEGLNSRGVPVLYDGFWISRRRGLKSRRSDPFHLPQNQPIREAFQIPSKPFTRCEGIYVFARCFPHTRMENMLQSRPFGGPEIAFKYGSQQTLISSCFFE